MLDFLFDTPMVLWTFFENLLFLVLVVILILLCLFIYAFICTIKQKNYDKLDRKAQKNKSYKHDRKYAKWELKELIKENNNG